MPYNDSVIHLTQAHSPVKDCLGVVRDLAHLTLKTFLNGLNVYKTF